MKHSLLTNRLQCPDKSFLKPLFRHCIVCFALGQSVLIVLGAAFAAEPPADSPAVRQTEQDELRTRALQFRQQADELFKAGKLTEAVEAARQSLAICEKIYGVEHAEVAEALNRVAVILVRQNPAEAQALLERALTIRRKVFPADHIVVAQSLHNLGAAHLMQKNADAAIPLLEEALKSREKAVGDEHLQLVETIQGLASAHHLKGNYAESRTLLERTLTIREKRLGTNHADVAKNLDSLVVIARSQSDEESAKRFSERAQQIRAKPTMNDLQALISGLGKMLETQTGQADAEQGLEGLRAMVRNQEQQYGKDHPKVADALVLLGGALGAQTQLAEAKSLFQRALVIYEMKYGRESEQVASALSGLAGVLYKEGDYAQSLALMRVAVRIQEQKLGAADFTTVSSRMALAAMLSSLGDIAAAREMSEQSLKLLEEKYGLHNPLVTLNVMTMAATLFDQGEFALARTLLKRSVRAQEAAFGTESPFVAQTLVALAAVDVAEGNYDAARQWLERAIAIHEKSPLKIPTVMATNYAPLGNVLSVLGEHEKAIALLERAQEIWVKATGENSAFAVSQLSDLAEAYDRAGRHADAARLYERRLDSMRRTLPADHPGIGASRVNRLGMSLMKAGSLEAAAPHFDEGLAAVRKAGKAHAPFLLDALVSHAEFRWTQGQREEAVAELAEACDLLEAHRLKSGVSEQQRAGFLMSYGEPLARMVLWQAELGNGTEAFAYAERGRGRAMLEWLTASRARVEDSLPEELRKKRAALLARLNALEIRRRALTDKPELLELVTDEILKTEREFERFAGEARAANSRYTLVHTPRPLGARELAQALRLDDKTVLVSFTTMREKSVALVLDHKGTVRSVFLRGESKGDAGKFSALLSAIESQPIDRKTGDQLHELYRTWFAPIQPLLEKKEKIIALADGALSLLPLEMLLAEAPQSDNPAEWAWLVKKYEIHYGPSGTVLAQLREERRAKSVERGAKKSLLAVADPPFSEQQAAEMKAEGAVKLAQATRGSGHEVFRDVGELFRFDATRTPPRLPGTRVEAQGVAKLLGDKSTTLLLGGDATEKRVWELSQSGELAKYRYVHFATHGWVDTERPERSGLLLSLADKSEGYDGILQMREIFALKLDADLVVLSACQTGRGKLMRGEGIIGLSQAFFYAGTPSLVVSLWNVNDASTALLMKRFYSNLKSEMPKSAALREAKLWLMTLTADDLKAEDKALAKTDTTRGLDAPVKSPPGKIAHPYAHPRHWAPFVLIGDSE